MFTISAVFDATKSQSSSADRQAILCSIEASIGPIGNSFITNSNGERCSLYHNSPLYLYLGVLDGYNEIYYLVTNDTSSATNASIINFKALFDSTTGSFLSLSALNGMITSGAGLLSFVLDLPAVQTQYNSLYNENLPVGWTASASMTSPNTISISFPSTVYSGSVFLGVDFASTPTLPTTEQLTNCRSLPYCRKFVVLSNQVHIKWYLGYYDIYCSRWIAQYIEIQDLLYACQ